MCGRANECIKMLENLKKSLGRNKYKCEHNIEMDLKEI
jgi:hypothetical protein